MIKVTVIVCTYNPDPKILKETLLSLKNQTLDKRYWELIVVDNNSAFPIPELNHLDWHINSQVVIEQKPGLVYARLAGFNLCQPGSLIVFADDDNILNENYLENCLAFSLTHPHVGCFGGRSLPMYETTPPDWFFTLGINLGCQDFGDKEYISRYNDIDYKLSHYPEKAPIGTGLVVTYDAFLAYAKGVNDDKLKLGRKGADLTSGEDNDIILTIVSNQFEIAYVPTLIVNHIIPKKRYSFTYLKNMAYKSNISWIKVLEMHHINPHLSIPKWTVPLRQAKAWIMLSAWKNKANYIKWEGACGVFRALSEINNG